MRRFIRERESVRRTSAWEERRSGGLSTVSSSLSYPPLLLPLLQLSAPFIAVGPPPRRNPGGRDATDPLVSRGGPAEAEVEVEVEVGGW
jgi:hypothetical protein